VTSAREAESCGLAARSPARSAFDGADRRPEGARDGPDESAELDFQDLCSIAVSAQGKLRVTRRRPRRRADAGYDGRR
jgi:hypothetical protein